MDNEGKRLPTPHSGCFWFWFFTRVDQSVASALLSQESMVIILLVYSGQNLGLRKFLA